MHSRWFDARRRIAKENSLERYASACYCFSLSFLIAHEWRNVSCFNTLFMLYPVSAWFRRHIDLHFLVTVLLFGSINAHLNFDSLILFQTRALYLTCCLWTCKHNFVCFFNEANYLSLVRLYIALNEFDFRRLVMPFVNFMRSPNYGSFLHWCSSGKVQNFAYLLMLGTCTNNHGDSHNCFGIHYLNFMTLWKRFLNSFGLFVKFWSHSHFHWIWELMLRSVRRLESFLCLCTIYSQMFLYYSSDDQFTVSVVRALLFQANFSMLLLNSRLLVEFQLLVTMTIGFKRIWLYWFT